jgi:hypothetical protein
MPATRSFQKLVDERLARDPCFRKALLRESVRAMLAGDVKTGWATLRRYLKP